MGFATIRWMAVSDSTSQGWTTGFKAGTRGSEPAVKTEVSFATWAIPTAAVIRLLNFDWTGGLEQVVAVASIAMAVQSTDSLAAVQVPATASCIAMATTFAAKIAAPTGPCLD